MLTKLMTQVRGDKVRGDKVGGDKVKQSKKWGEGSPAGGVLSGAGLESVVLKGAAGDVQGHHLVQLLGAQCQQQTGSRLHGA